jgi:hypothetical protein
MDGSGFSKSLYIRINPLFMRFLPSAFTILFATVIFFVDALHAQVSLTATPHTQNFNTLAKTGTASTLPAGWLLLETGTNANATYTAGTGSSNSGDTYSFGIDAADDRALGTVQSGSLVSSFGVAFTNTTGGAITSLKIAYVGEHWRLGATARADRLDFQYSTDATSLATGTWINADQLDFTGPITTGTVGALDGTVAANAIAINFTITGLNIGNGATFYLRWSDFNATGADDGLGIDDFSIEAISAGSDNTAPTISSVNPANNATGINTSTSLVLNFSEPIAKGTGLVSLKKFADNTTVSTFDVATAAVSVVGSVASIAVSGLTLSTKYYVEVPNSAFTDVAGNKFAGFTGNSTWSFTTSVAPEFSFDFNNCAGGLPSGWSQISVKGDSVWACSIFGNANTNGVQVNGFVSGTGAADNEDWLISPALDLSLFQFPILSFSERTKFSGPQIQLLVASNQASRPAPGAAAWTPVDAMLPLPNSDKWTAVNDINLAAFKSGSSYIAFKYISSPALGAARVSLDDVQIKNRTSAPVAKVFLETPTLSQFDNSVSGTPTVSKSIRFQVMNASADLNITAPSLFQISRDNLSFSSSLTFTAAQLAGGAKTIHVRYVPVTDKTTAVGKIGFSAAGSTAAYYDVAGNTYSRNATLDVVNWNILWFGSTAAGQGPTNDDLAQANIKRVMDSLDADIYAFSEVVDINRFKTLIESSAGYGFIVSDYCSNAANTSNGSYAPGQKIAFAYRKSVITNATARGLLKSSTAANSNWASGRVPFLLQADVVNGTATKKMNFILVHGKSGSTASDHLRRKDGAKELKDTLDASFNAASVIILGDYNDDLDSTISEGVNPALSSYVDIVKDSTDADRYKAISMILSNTGHNSMIGYNDFIDHVIISNELEADYINGSVRLIREVNDWIANYATTTADHIPVLSRYLLPSSGTTAVNSFDPNQIGLTLIQNPVKNRVELKLNPEAGKLKFDIISISGHTIYNGVQFNTNTGTKSHAVEVGNAADGIYLLRVTNNEKTYFKKFLKQH